MPPSKTVDSIIEDAMRRGEFNDLPGAGKPIDLSTYFNTPEEVRLAYSILKNASVLPQEADLLKEISILKEQLDTITDPTQKKKISKTLQETLLSYNLLMERQKNPGKINK